MLWRLLLRELILLIVALSAWFTGLFWHKGCSETSSEAVHAPFYVSMLFGVFQPNGVLHFRGILIQLFAYVITPIFTLMIFNIISSETAIRIFGWAGVLLALVSIVFLWLRR